MTNGRLNLRWLFGFLALTAGLISLMSGPASADPARHAGVPTFSVRTGRIPSSERVRRTLHAGANTTFFPAPKNVVARTSQSAALIASGAKSPLRVDGRAFYPRVLFGLVSNSAMRSVCNPPVPTQPSTTPTTACRKGLFYQRTPAWVIIQRGFCVPSTGGPYIPTSGSSATTNPLTTTTTPNPARCVLYTYVDAATGKSLYSEN
jgi:hypothetical protein